MTKKDYRLIADALYRSRSLATDNHYQIRDMLVWRASVDSIAAALATNAGFDIARFKRWCETGTDALPKTPVFADLNHQADVIGQAATASEAMAIYAKHFAGTGAVPVKAVRVVRDRRGEGPVDGWAPELAEKN